MDLDAAALPGGDGFIDVTDVFQNAGAEMEPGSFILMDGFGLQDAMSAFEIGEPRLDSGVLLDSTIRPPFDPLAPLLPQEVCWIMDQSFAYEMQWHAGNALSQTVFTLLFIHGLDEINPDTIPSQPQTDGDPDRPIELITVVLRAFISGMLKCCDLAWKDMSKGGIQDNEDWQSEKCDVWLPESLSEALILKMLDDADVWLQASPRAPMQWRDDLRARISLRKTLLDLMHRGVYHNPGAYEILIRVAHQQLRHMRSRPSPTPEPNSPPQLTFDPHITRRLNSFAPLRVVQLPPIETTWDAVDALLDGLWELSRLTTTHDISTWENVGYLRLWMPNPLRRIPWLRACARTAFFDDYFVLNQFPPTWLLDHFLVETLGISWNALPKMMAGRWKRDDEPPVGDIERKVQKLVAMYIRALWNNQSRCRRQLAKSLLDWHRLYDIVRRMTSKLAPPKSPGVDALILFPTAILVWRYKILREVVLSGFQLELYNADEKTFAYWYITQIIEEHVTALDSLLSVVPKASPMHEEMKHQQQFLTALQLMCTAVFSVVTQMLTLDWERIRLNFLRRYKWAFRPEYDRIESAPPASPDYPKFLPACAEMLKVNVFPEEAHHLGLNRLHLDTQSRTYSPSDSCRLANHILRTLLDSGRAQVGHWTEERLQLLRQLARVSEDLYVLPSTLKSVPRFDVSTLEWDPRYNPWFPKANQKPTATEVA